MEYHLAYTLSIPYRKIELKIKNDINSNSYE